MTLLFYLSENLPSWRKGTWTWLLTNYFLLVGIMSQHYLLKVYSAPLHNSVPGPGVALTHYDYKKSDRTFRQLSEKCHYYGKKSRYLILDDATYFSFQKNYYPILYTYLFFGLCAKQSLACLAGESPAAEAAPSALHSESCAAVGNQSSEA